MIALSVAAYEAKFAREALLDLPKDTPAPVLEAARRRADGLEARHRRLFLQAVQSLEARGLLPARGGR